MVANEMTTKSFKAQVDQAFTAYLIHATAVLQQPQSLKQRMTRVAYIDPGARLRTLVEEAEDSAEFAELSSAMHQALPQQNYSDGMLKTFLRRSRFYLRAFNGEQLSPDELFNRLCSGLFQRSVKTTIMRILVGVNFASRVVDCGAFKIQKFTKDELDILTEKEINDVLLSICTNGHKHPKPILAPRRGIF